MSQYDHIVRSSFRRNFAVNVADFALWSVGAAIISTSTVLPLYLRHLTSSPMLIGLIPAVQFLGWRLPQLFTGHLVQKLPRKKPFVVWMALNERVPFIILGFFILLWQPADKNLALIIVFLLLTWQALGGGLIANAWQEMVAKICLPTHWGLFFGTANALGALLALGGAALSGLLLARYPYPLNFAYSYLIASAFLMVSWATLHLIVEPPKLPSRPPPAFVEYLRRLPDVLRQDPNFRGFILVRVFGSFGAMGSGFLAVHAAERFHLGDEAAAGFTATMMLTMALLNPILGRIGDRRGHKSVITMSFWVQVASMAVAAVAPNPTVFLVAFAAKAAVEAAFMSSGMPIVFEFAPEDERPTYIGLANTLTAPPLILVPLIGGLLATAAGYTVVFWFSAVLGVAGAVAWMRLVQDPRTTRPALDYPLPGAPAVATNDVT